MPCSCSRATASTTAGWSGALSSTPAEPRRAIVVEDLDQLGGGSLLAEVEAAADDRGPQPRQLGLEGGPHGRAEPRRRVHHQVDAERPAAQLHLVALPVELLDGPLDLGGGALPAPPARRFRTRSTVAWLSPAWSAISWIR